MKQVRLIMGMPIVIEIVGNFSKEVIFNNVFSYFRHIDEKFSPFKIDSEVTRINKDKIAGNKFSIEMREILALGEKTKNETNGYFNMYHKDKFDPSGIVKGWAIHNAAKIIKDGGYTNFYIEAGGDIEVSGKNQQGKPWSIGIRNPFDKKKIVKVLHVTNYGIATSGTYEKGQHIYNPVSENQIEDIISLTVVGPNVLEADRFATAAFAMGKKGIDFIHSRKDLEGYMIDKEGIATYTKGFEMFVI